MISISGLFLPVPLGIMLGLFVGKSIGVFTVSWLVIKGGLARLPGGSSWPQLFAVSTLTGIGFTMSLFLSALAFNVADVGLLRGVIFKLSMSLAPP